MSKSHPGSGRTGFFLQLKRRRMQVYDDIIIKAVDSQLSAAIQLRSLKLLPEGIPFQAFIHILTERQTRSQSEVTLGRKKII